MHGLPRRRLRQGGTLLLTGLLAACVGSAGGSGAGEPVEPDSGIAVQVVAEMLSSPVALTAPSGDPRLFVVEQVGRIRIIEGGQLLEAPFLDIVSRVRSGGEQGLLGLAFHPEYAQNGFFYVNFTDAEGDTRVERFRVSSDPAIADPTSARLIIAVEQPYGNHNGGEVAFGPDGMLYVGMGDGGSANDPHGHGQNRGTLLGALLRLDVDGGEPYAVPPDNPLVGVQGARAEIWAFGLRNPWRFSFDREAGVLYVADVGQNSWEEVNAAPSGTAGVNYGWNVMEGTHCFRAITCDQAGLTLPIVEYGHDDGCSVIGGFVYRGGDVPQAVGHYFYSDYCKGWLRSFRYDGGRVLDHTEWRVGDLGSVLSFGEDARGELYVLSQDGRVYRIVKAR